MRKLTSSPEITGREVKNKKIARKLAAEGIVLLENNGVLPLPSSLERLALFGSGARRTVKGGTGSGDVNVRDYVTVEQGLISAGFQITTGAWLNEQECFIESAKEAYEADIRQIAAEEGPHAALLWTMEHPFQEPEFRRLKEEELGNRFTDTAIYVLARNSGEGADRKLIPGDYLLTEGEIHDIALLAGQFPQFILLLNVGGVIDMQALRGIQGIDAIANISQGGSAFGDAVADVLTGKVTPSGKLTATWARHYEDYPCALSFAGMNGDKDDSWYEEGIYVGYRYFDSFRIEPQYAFGYGVSYTEFQIDIKTVRFDNGIVDVDVKVTNTGHIYSGKEVVQVYCGAPSEDMEKPYQELCVFWKTKNLLPGESESHMLSFPLSQIASYQESTASYVLEKGEYIIRVGNSSKHTQIAAVLNLTETVVTEQCKNLFGNEAVSLFSQKGKNDDSETVRKIKADVPYIRADSGFVSKIIHNYTEKKTPIKPTQSDLRITLQDVKEGRAALEDLVSQLTQKEMTAFCVGGARMNMQDFSVIGNASDTIPGAAGETTKSLWESRKIPSIAMADGPAGLRVNPEYYLKDGLLLKDLSKDPLFKNILPKDMLQTDLSEAEVYYQYCTAIPTAIMLAQSWNEEVLKAAGDLIGEEMEEMGIDLWLAPGMNLQRNPLGGRNFEYYSEDPFLSGVCAAYITEGVQSHPGRGTVIKHMAANSQETNRNYNNSHLTERTLRELYLKGFEICVKQAAPYAVMTSVNLVNGIHAANHYDMLTAVLRDEWGFDGMVMTDWGTTSQFGRDTGSSKYGCSSAAACIKAGNDLIMPGSQSDVDKLNRAVQEGELTIGELQWCVKNILGTAIKTIQKS